MTQYIRCIKSITYGKIIYKVKVNECLTNYSLTISQNNRVYIPLCKEYKHTEIFGVFTATTLAMACLSGVVNLRRFEGGECDSPNFLGVFLGVRCNAMNSIKL